MDLNIWNNQKITIDWKLCFICRQQGKDKFRSTRHGIKSLYRIGSGVGGREFLKSHVQVSFLLHMMKQNWKIILLKKKQSTTRFVQIVITARNYNVS